MGPPQPPAEAARPTPTVHRTDAGTLIGFRHTDGSATRFSDGTRFSLDVSDGGGVVVRLESGLSWHRVSAHADRYRLLLPKAAVSLRDATALLVCEPTGDCFVAAVVGVVTVEPSGAEPIQLAPTQVAWLAPEGGWCQLVDDGALDELTDIEWVEANLELDDREQAEPPAARLAEAAAEEAPALGWAGALPVESRPAPAARVEPEPEPEPEAPPEVVAPEPEPEVVAAGPEPEAEVAEPEPEPEPDVVAAEPEPVAESQPAVSERPAFVFDDLAGWEPESGRAAAPEPAVRPADPIRTGDVAPVASPPGDRRRRLLVALPLGVVALATVLAAVGGSVSGARQAPAVLAGGAPTTRPAGTPHRPTPPPAVAGGQRPSAAPTTTAPPATTTTAAPPTTAAAATPPTTAAAGTVGYRVAPSGCTQDGTVATMSGTATNTGSQPVVLRIVGRFSDAGGRPVATGQTTLSLPPGARSGWQLTASYTGSLAGGSCQVVSAGPA